MITRLKTKEYENLTLEELIKACGDSLKSIDSTKCGVTYYCNKDKNKPNIEETFLTKEDAVRNFLIKLKKKNGDNDTSQV